MNFKTLDITPEIASELLKKNLNNRKLTERTVNFYVKQMIDGLWKSNTGEAIKIAKSGRLLDGQHRLAAIAKSGVTVNLAIVEDLEEEIFSVLDTGKKRNAGDILTISGIDNANVKAAGITSWLTLERGHSLRGEGDGSNKTELGITNQMILDEYNRRPDFWNMISNESNKNYFAFKKIITTSYIMGWTAKLYEIDPIKAFEFMNKLCTGIELTEYDSRFQLRNILISAKSSATRKLDSKYRNALFIKAWNNFITGSKNNFLRYNPKIDKNYPVLIGSNTMNQKEKLAEV